MSRKRSADSLAIFTPAKRSYAKGGASKKRAYRSSIRPFPGSSTNTGFPKVLKFSHRFCNTITRDSTNTTNDYLSISTNGMFDPAGSWFGDQPYYFDQVSPLYLQYAVIASTCKFTVSPIQYDANQPVLATAFVHATGARASGNRNVLAMRPTSKTIVCGRGASARSIYLRWSAKSNLQSDALKDDTLQGRDNANPSEQQFYQIVVGTGDPADHVGANVTCDITYYAAWTELRDVAGS